MIRVGITGGDGFVGSHLRFFLHEHKDTYETVLIDKDDFAEYKNLLSKIGKCDIIVHLAGLNRGDEKDIYNTNVGLTRKVLDGCDEIGKKPRIIFLSSIQNTRDTGYGMSKKKCEDMVYEWGKKNKIFATSVVAPNLFGEFGRNIYLNMMVFTNSITQNNKRVSVLHA